ncbi:MAG: DUF445 family protein [Opitutales bacterium]|jgi:uncharacterized membrane protein YheB (UPF0754 family)
MNNYDIIYLICLPLTTALIGWLTNKAAIYMLFHPREPRRVWPLRLQGLIPRRKKEIARLTAEMIARELLSEAHIENRLGAMDSGEMVEELAHKLVHEGLEPRLARIPLIGGTIVRNSIEGIHQAVLEELRKEAPMMQKRLAARIAKKIDVQAMVEDRINALDTGRMEEVVRKVASRELRGIEVMGAVLGFAIGLLQTVGLILSRMA